MIRLGFWIIWTGQQVAVFFSRDFSLHQMLRCLHQEVFGIYAVWSHGHLWRNWRHVSHLYINRMWELGDFSALWKHHCFDFSLHCISLVYLGWTLSTCCPTNTHTQTDTHTPPWRPGTVTHLRMRKHTNSLLHVLDSPAIKSADLHLYKTQYVDSRRFHPRVGPCCSNGLHSAEPAAHIFRQRTPVRSNVQVKWFKLQDLPHDFPKHSVSETSLHEEGSTGCRVES